MKRNEFGTGEWRLETESQISNLQSSILVSYSQVVSGVTPAVFLRQALGQARFYWQDGRVCDPPVTFAAFGVAAELTAWGENRFHAIEQQARNLFQGKVWFNDVEPLAGPRLFGGFAFHDDFAPDNTWSLFYPAHFILPHYQLTQVGDVTWLTINTLLPPDEDPDNSLPQLHEALDARYALLCKAAIEPARIPIPANGDIQINYPMPFTIWESKINEAVQQMHTSDLNKVVLARICEIRLPDRVDVDGALAYLDEQYTGCYRFLFEPTPMHAFFGATPELLVQVDGRTVTTMGLASSIRRGRTATEDAQLAHQLLTDPKERYEHDLVVASIQKRLAPFTTKLHVPAEPAVYPLSYIQHLYTPIQGQLRQPVGVLPIVAALHPTPALGGSPRDLAMDFICQAEPAPRGWYAAPIGWIDHKLDGAFAVAIRSAVNQVHRAWLYAGAGIVADSNPRKEWEETELKFRPMLQALCGISGAGINTIKEK